MPMQKIETIDEPASRLKAQGNLFALDQLHKLRKDDPSTSSGQAFRNMLIWGDNKLVMASLLKDFKGKIDLIYIDPPFDVGADFTMDIPIGDGKESIGKDQSTLEAEVVYRLEDGTDWIPASAGMTEGKVGMTGNPESVIPASSSVVIPVKTGIQKKFVDIKLKNFVPSLAEVPSKELETLKERAIKSGFDFIDFWAVDFDYQDGEPFEHHWQAYRTRKDRSLPTVSNHEFDKYPKKGKYTACVKVVDIFGCDTSITVEVEI